MALEITGTPISEGDSVMAFWDSMQCDSCLPRVLEGSQGLGNAILAVKM